MKGLTVRVTNYTDTHCLAIVEKRGRQYTAVWALPKPTETEVIEAYTQNPRWFEPYNVRRGY